jgi:hypothetical protein
MTLGRVTVPREFTDQGAAFIRGAICGFHGWQPTTEPQTPGGADWFRAYCAGLEHGRATRAARELIPA